MARNPKDHTIASSLSPETGIRVLREFHREGSELLSRRPLNKNDIYAWMNKGRELLIKCFGSESKNATEFEQAGTFSWPKNDSPQAWDDLRAETLDFQLKLISGCIDNLRIELEASLPAKAVERQIGTDTTEVFLVHGQNEAVPVS